MEKVRKSLVLGRRCIDKKNAYKDYPLPTPRIRLSKAYTNRDRVYELIDVENICWQYF